MCYMSFAQSTFTVKWQSQNHFKWSAFEISVSLQNLLCVFSVYYFWKELKCVDEVHISKVYIFSFILSLLNHIDCPSQLHLQLESDSPAPNKIKLTKQCKTWKYFIVSPAADFILQVDKIVWEDNVNRLVLLNLWAIGLQSFLFVTSEKCSLLSIHFLANITVKPVIFQSHP